MRTTFHIGSSLESGSNRSNPVWLGILLLLSVSVAGARDEGPPPLGAPPPFEEFAKGFQPPPSAQFQNRAPYQLRVGFVRTAEPVPRINGITTVEVPDARFREGFQWIDVQAQLYSRNRKEEGKVVNTSPSGETLPRGHFEGAAAYLLPRRVNANGTVQVSVLFHHSEVVGWSAFFNLDHGARLALNLLQTDELDLPLDKWVIIPGTMIPPHPQSAPQEGHLYYLLRLTSP